MFVFFKKFLEDTCPFLGPYLGTQVLRYLVKSHLGFKVRVGSALFAIFAEKNDYVHSPRFNSGATLADLLYVRRADGHFPTCRCRGGTWHQDSKVQPHEHRSNALPLCKRPELSNLGHLNDYAVETTEH